MKTKEQARDTLIPFLHFLSIAMKEAKEKGSVELGILARDAEGGGKVTCTFEAEEFLEDLNVALDLPEPTKDQILDAKALLLVTQFRSGS